MTEKTTWEERLGKMRFRNKTIVSGHKLDWKDMTGEGSNQIRFPVNDFVTLKNHQVWEER